jgi:two-component system response regulator MtrA
VLVVEDHHSIARSLQENLEHEGFEVRVAGDGIEAIRVSSSWKPGLVLLDLMLPKRSGFDVLAAMRARGDDTPVLVLSARGSEAEKVRALRAGADDYVVKPFGLMEVLARVHALLRRIPGSGVRAEREERYELGDVSVDVPTRSVRRNGRDVVLRPREFDLLVALCRARGAVVSRDMLLNRVWGYGPDVVTRTVDTHIAALRQRLEKDADDPRLIVTVWKAGYRLATMFLLGLSALTACGDAFSGREERDLDEARHRWEVAMVRRYQVDVRVAGARVSNLDPQAPS